MKKPIPPPCRLSCGFCGYTASEPEYNHICWSAISLAILLMTIPISLILIIMFKILM